MREPLGILSRMRWTLPRSINLGLAVTLVTLSLAASAGGALAAPPNKANPSKSSLVASPTSVAADGVATSTITATVRNKKNVPLADKAVTLARVSGPAATISAPSGPSNGSGVVTWTVSSTVAGTTVFRATDTSDGVVINQTASVTFLAGVPNAVHSGAVASPTSVTANGSSKSTVTVTLRDINDNPVSGKTVTLAQTLGQPSAISPASGPSTAAGVVTFLVSSTVAGSATYQATDTTDAVTVSQTVTVTYTAGSVNAVNCTVSANPSSVPADGSTTSTITVILRDANNNRVPGKTVALAQSAGPAATIVPPNSAIVDGSGTVTFTVKSTNSGSATFQATDTTDSNLAVGSATVAFTPGPVAGSNSSVAASPTAVPANGSTTSTITVTVRDSLSNPVPGHSVLLAQFSGPASTIGGTNPATTNGSGVVTFTVSSTVSGIATYHATDQTGPADIGYVDVTFNPGPVTALNSSISANPTTVAADGSPSMITVILRDANNNPVPGKTVVLSQTSGAPANLSPASGLSDASGTVTYFVSSLSAGVAGFRATDSTDANLVVGNVNVTFSVGAVSGTSSTVVAGPTPLVADGLATSTITVTVHDGSNNPVAGKTVSVTQVGGPPATIVPPGSPVSDGAGHVAFTVKSVNPGVDLFQAVADGVTITPSVPVDFTRQLQTTLSPDQNTLANSDGNTWVDLDTDLLTMTVTPTVDSLAILGANVDLWTANAGVNQDVGINVTPSNSTTFPGNIVAWKESGGFAGTFSPNAAFVHTVFPMTANTTYTVKVQWKTNKPAQGTTIYAAAGPWPGGGTVFSPSTLTAELVPVSASADTTRVSTLQYNLAGASDGQTWQDMDAANLSFNVTPSHDSLALLTANSDLWTANAGYNQDIGINVTPSSTGTYPSNIVAWKESGGFAGTFSPNAAAAQTVFPMTQGVTYTVKLQWKANKAAPGGTLFAGAGAWPAGSGKFSPTRVSALLLPIESALQTASSRNQYQQTGSDGNNWVDMQTSTLHLTLNPTVDSIAVLSANADLWTANAGLNQDIGIKVTPTSTVMYPGNIVAWKESGGFAGTFSPNAAFSQTILPLTGGTSYDVTLQWKTNVASPGNATIYSGAGPWPGGSSTFSPTNLTALVYPTS
ncbi:MAG: Ig-like domain-containing protein [Candidatus Dormibacteraeota bacterium]|nr:Ig-like domain-containing protein [Candidatus Dormibacteraeota bacterium]